MASLQDSSSELVHARVVVVGAGPAGISTALAFAALGARVSVLERTKQPLPQAGVALTLWPNGLRALAAIDPELPERLISRGAATEFVRFLDREGNTLAAYPLELRTRYGFPCLNLRWSVLEQSLRETLSADVIRYGSDVETVTRRGPHTRVICKDGREEEADLVVIADGVHSPLRAQLLSDGPPREHGRFIFRSIVPRHDDEVREREACFFAGVGQSGTLLDVGFGAGFWSCALVTDERFEDLDLAQTKALIAARFPEFPAHFHRAVERAEVIVGRRLLDRDLAPSLAEHETGLCALVGDACHAMIPTIGQGVSQAFEDAVELAFACKMYGVTREALRAFEAKRLPRVRVIGARAALLGHQVMHSKNADALRDPLRGIAGHEVELATGDQAHFDAWVYGYEPPRLRD